MEILTVTTVTSFSLQADHMDLMILPVSFSVLLAGLSMRNICHVGMAVFLLD